MASGKTVLDEYTPLQVERGVMSIGDIIEILRSQHEIFVVARKNLGAILPEDEGQRARMLSPAQLLEEGREMRLSFEDPEVGSMNTRIVEEWIRRTRGRLVIVVRREGNEIPTVSSEPSPLPETEDSSSLFVPNPIHPNHTGRVNSFAAAAAELDERLRDAETGEKRRKIEELAQWLVDRKFCLVEITHSSIQLYRKSTENTGQMYYDHIHSVLRELGMRCNEGVYRCSDTEVQVGLFLQVLAKCIDKKTRKRHSRSLGKIEGRLEGVETGDFFTMFSLSVHRAAYRERAVYLNLQIIIPR